jgi:hypothetical protein
MPRHPYPAPKMAIKTVDFTKVKALYFDIYATLID